MKFSVLQKEILLSCYNRGDKKINRRVFELFCQQKSHAKESLRVKILTQSLENLIEKNLLIGYGIRTPKKWFLQAVSLTKQGHKISKKLFSEQLKLKLGFRK